MMVFQSSNVLANKTIGAVGAGIAATIATTQSKLDSITNGSSHSRGGKLKRSSSTSRTVARRVSEDLKRSIAKDLSVSKTRSRSSSPPVRTLSKAGSKKKKDRKNKLKKKSMSDPSLHTLGVSSANKEGEQSSTGKHNSTFSLTPSETSKKKLKRKSSTKKTLQESLKAVDIYNRKILGTSEHSSNTKTTACETSVSTSTISTAFHNCNKGNEPMQPPVRSPSIKKKKSKKGARSSEDESSLSSSKGGDSLQPSSFKENSPETAVKPLFPPGSSPTLNKRRQIISFESIHGKSIHKPKTRRARGNTDGTSADKQPTSAESAPPPPQHATLAPSPGTVAKRKSVLKAKKEKQAQEKRELEARQKALKEAEAAAKEQLKLSSPPLPKHPDYKIKDVMDIVSSHRRNLKATNANNNTVDDDDCSSQSSSCSYVSEGSYEKDDLLSQSSHSNRGDFQNTYDTPDSILGDFAIDIEGSPVAAPTPFSAVNHNKDDGSFKDMSFKDDNSFKDESFKGISFKGDDPFEENNLDTSFKGSNTPLSPLTEVIEDESPKTTPSEGKWGSLKTALKTSSQNTAGSSFGRPPLRLVPKRSKSDVSSLSGSSRGMGLLRSNSNGRRKPPSRQRTLSFNEKVRVKRVPCQAQIAGGDPSELWFQPQEYEAIKRKTMALIRAVQDDQTGGVTYCTRGLERYFAVDAVQDKRNDAWDSVLDEQEMQRLEGRSFDSDRMSRVYSQCTRLSSQEALERGKLDEDAIARYTKKMRQSLRRTCSMPI